MKDWVVTTTGDRPLEEVARELTKCGFQVSQVLTEIGLITGEGGDDVAAAARGIPGVADVSANVGADAW